MARTNFTNSNTLENNVAPLNRQEFTIGDHALVIDMLINKYKYPIRTAVQEYLSNARDAMREAGNIGPIDVTLPTKLNPVFKVRDYGVGLSRDRVKNIFTVFGNSTKRQTALQTGGFGIGAKSAWAYTDAFTIVTYVDGQEDHYIAHRGTSRSGALDHVYTGKTKEKNGTEVQIAVNPSDIEDFKHAIKRATYFWKEPINYKGMLDSSEMNRVKGDKVGQYLEIFEQGQVSNAVLSNSSELFLIVDGIVYPMGYEFTHKIDSMRKIKALCKGKITIHIGNELVEVLASRESLADTEHTTKNLTTICDKALEELRDHLKSQLTSVSNPFEFAEVYAKLSNFYYIPSDLTEWRGYSINMDAIRHADFSKLKMTSVHNNKKSGGRSATKVYRDERMAFSSSQPKYVYLGELDVLYFDDLGDESIVLRNRRFRELFSSGVGDILVIGPNDDMTTAEFNKFKKTFKLKPLSSLTLPPKAPKTPRTTIPREQQEFCMHIYNRWNNRVTQWTTVDENEKTYYYFKMVQGSPSGFNSSDIGRLNGYLIEINAGCQIVGLSEASIKKVKDDVNFKPIEEFFKTHKVPTDYVNMHYHWAYNEEFRKLFKTLKEKKLLTKIEDDKISEMLKEYSKIASKVKDLTTVNGLPYLVKKNLKLDSELEIIVKKSDAVMNYLNKNYSLSLGILEDANYMMQKNLEEAIEFMNYKYNKGVKNA